MARSLNKAMVIGNIQPNDPELRKTDSGQSVCTFKVVTDESYVDKSGEKQERSEWHRIVFWGKAGELIAQYMTKGRRIYVEGRIQTRQYEQDGVTRYSTEIVGSDFLFLDSKEGDGNTGNGSAPAPKAATVETTADDDLPF